MGGDSRVDGGETTVELVAGKRSNGSTVMEQVLVRPVGAAYRVVRSPGLVLGIAAGDLIELKPGGEFVVAERGRNVCVQLFCPEGIGGIEALVSVLIGELGGRVDGRAPKELVLTIHIDAGFARIERVLNDITTRFGACQWYYGNVYDPKDGVTPLNWWQ